MRIDNIQTVIHTHSSARPSSGERGSWSPAWSFPFWLDTALRWRGILLWAGRGGEEKPSRGGGAWVCVTMENGSFDDRTRLLLSLIAVRPLVVVVAVGVVVVVVGCGSLLYKGRGGRGVLVGDAEVVISGKVIYHE